MTIHLTKIRQRFPRPRIGDVPSSVIEALESVSDRIAPGESIALTVGSRGIANIATLAKTTVDFVKARGAVPFIIPAMGSHGGGTAQGQVEVLASYGISASTMGCPIRSSMETVELTPPDAKNRVYMDRYAYEADGVILMNRIKVHTDYHGPYESGLVKMSVIGLGKHRQALEIHSWGVYGLRHLIPWTAQQVFGSGKIRFGLAVLENAYDETMLVRALPAESILAEEPGLLDISRANMPSLPVDDIDILMLDRMGKDISGAGLDPNIIGRNMIRGEQEPERPRIKMITVHDLTDASHGNAVGMGLADVIARRLYDKIDLQATNENIVTSSFLLRGKIPVVAPDDATAYAYALRSCGRIPESDLRVVRVRDTLSLGEALVSDAVLRELSGASGIEVAGPAGPAFGDDGALMPF
ncbi:MAG: DUF2088 domain-containing protein [Anaerolineae bacterium]|jgi:hypothetical protein|nr:DUF2088 domain-containing protein [Anaerolineae bacterium]